MLHLALWHIGFGDPISSGFGMWMFLSIGAVSLFVIFIPTVSWIEARRKEREAFYKADTIRRLAESSGDGAKAAVELMRQQDRQQRVKTREGMKIGGITNLAVGIALLIFLRALIGNQPVYLCGLIPGFIGVGMLTYAFFLAPPLD
jgi:hypothetical protein